jgi:hypothetical protein
MGYSGLSPGKKDANGKGFHTGEKTVIGRKVTRFYYRLSEIAVSDSRKGGLFDGSVMSNTSNILKVYKSTSLLQSLQKKKHNRKPTINNMISLSKLPLGGNRMACMVK